MKLPPGTYATLSILVAAGAACAQIRSQPTAGMSYRPTVGAPAPIVAPAAGSASCRWKVKAQLRDPDSFREEDFRPAADGTALLVFRSRNGFGGYARGAAICRGSGDSATAQLVGAS